MLSVETSDVSSVPGREVWKSWIEEARLWSAFQSKMRSTQKYCAPTFELRFSHFGFSGSAGGLIGFGPTWQNPHDMPTRYGCTRFCVVVVRRIACSSAPRPSACAAASSKSGFGNSRRPTMPVARRSTSRPARSCRARRSRRPGTSARSRTDRAGSRRDALIEPQPVAVRIGPVALSKQGSLTRPR